MIDWAAQIETGFAVPDDLDTSVDELVAMLAAADPVVRDDQAYSVLVTWIRRGVLDDRLADIGETMVRRLGHPEIQARTFAPLILAAVVDRDSAANLVDTQTARRWLGAFTASCRRKPTSAAGTTASAGCTPSRTAQTWPGPSGTAWRGPWSGSWPGRS